MKRIFYIILFFIGMNSLEGQTKKAVGPYSVAYRDSCQMIINAFNSPTDQRYISDYLNRFEMCRYLGCWLESNSYSEDAKKHLMMAVYMINEDPEYIMERFIELYEAIKTNPNYLLDNFGETVRDSIKMD